MSSLDKYVMQTQCLDKNGYWIKRSLFINIEESNWTEEYLERMKNIEKTHSTTRKVLLSC